MRWRWVTGARRRDARIASRQMQRFGAVIAGLILLGVLATTASSEALAIFEAAKVPNPANSDLCCVTPA